MSASWLNRQKWSNMKFKTTAKAIRQGAYKSVSAGYCDLQYLLWYTSPIAYTSGVYGWNFDVYEIDDLVICTGYRGMVGGRAICIREFEGRARAIVNSNTPLESKQRQVKLLLNEFIRINKVAEA